MHLICPLNWNTYLQSFNEICIFEKTWPFCLDLDWNGRHFLQYDGWSRLISFFSSLVNFANFKFFWGLLEFGVVWDLYSFRFLGHTRLYPWAVVLKSIIMRHPFTLHFTVAWDLWNSIFSVLFRFPKLVGDMLAILFWSFGGSKKTSYLEVCNWLCSFGNLERI